MKASNVLILLALSVQTAGCSDDSDSESEAPVDVVSTAIEAGSFNTLVAAVQAADLEATLRSPGPFTVFAPPDSAFAKLPAGTVDSLLLPENKAMLAGILTYHVVSGKVSSAMASTLPSAKTVQGSNLTITSQNGKLMIDGATVVTPDIACSNGVIHVIDSVLLPK